jgi:hypothetical protein
MKVAHAESFTQPLASETPIPIMTVQESVAKLFSLNPLLGPSAPLWNVLVKVFFGNKFRSSTRHAQDANAIAAGFFIRLPAESARPDVHLVPELGELFRQLEHVHHLAAGIDGS